LSVQLLLKIIASLIRLKEYWQGPSNHNDDGGDDGGGGGCKLDG
jgi:hypothetical protein